MNTICFLLSFFSALKKTNSNDKKNTNKRHFSRERVFLIVDTLISFIFAYS